MRVEDRLVFLYLANSKTDVEAEGTLRVLQCRCTGQSCRALLPEEGLPGPPPESLGPARGQGDEGGPLLVSASLGPEGGQGADSEILEGCLQDEDNGPLREKIRGLVLYQVRLRLGAGQIMSEQQAKTAVKAALFTLNASCSPGQDQLRVHEESEGETFSINFPAKAGSLVFVPFTQVMTEDGVKTRVLDKQPDSGDVELPRMKVTQKGTKAHAMTLQLHPSDAFSWKFSSVTRHQSADAPTLTFQTVTAQTTIASAAQMTVKKKVHKKTGKVTLEMTFEV